MTFLLFLLDQFSGRIELCTQQQLLGGWEFAGLIEVIGFNHPVSAASGLDRFTVENFNLEKDIS